MRRKKRLTITLLLIAFILNIKAQETLNFRQVDSLTYQLYENQSWEQVLKTGRKALKNDIDYYYLRMRMGIAAFEAGKPAMAANQFQKALSFNENDPVAMEYLYDSYLEMGKNNRAWQLSRNFSPSLKSSLTTKMKTVESVDFMGGTMFSNNYQKNNDLYIMGADSLFGKQRLYGDEYYLHAGLRFNVSPSFSIYAGFHNLNIRSKSNFQTITYQGVYTVDTSWGFTRYPDTIPDTDRRTFNNPINQNEAYLNMRFQFGKGWALSLYSDILFINVNKTKAIYESVTMTDTAYYVDATGDFELFDYETDSYTFSTYDSSFVNWVAGFNVEKDLNTVVFSLTGSLSQLNKGNQQQLGLSALYYPFGGSVFYGYTGTIFYHTSYRQGSGSGNGNGKGQGRASQNNAENRFIFTQKLGVRLFRSGWLEGEIYRGNLNNINLDNAFIVYNLPEQISLSAGLSFTVLLSRHVELGIYYRYLDKSGNFFTYDSEHTRFENFTFNYQTQSLIGGLKWRF